MISVKIFSLGLIGLFLGCKSTRNDASKETVTVVQNEEITDHRSSDSCPENGTCEWSVMSDTNLVIKEDTIGSLYPVFEKEVGTHTIKFMYDRAVKEGLADGGYREVIYLRIPATTTSISLKDERLQDVGLIYGRLCFCRGATGYYPITKGVLKLDKTKEGYKIQLAFENGKVPQLINNLDGIAVVDNTIQTKE